MKVPACVIAAAVALVACTGPDVDKPAVSGAAPGDAAAIVRRPLPETPLPAPGAAGPPEQPPFAPASIPPGTLYVCVSESAGQRHQTAIEFAPKVAELCRKAPEMGPCQYERENCRRSGGRVFTADGSEITPFTEAEYNKRVMRIRMKSN
jgi:hypothetical protein